MLDISMKWQRVIKIGGIVFGIVALISTTILVTLFLQKKEVTITSFYSIQEKAYIKTTPFSEHITFKSSSQEVFLEKVSDELYMFNTTVLTEQQYIAKLPKTKISNVAIYTKIETINGNYELSIDGSNIILTKTSDEILQGARYQTELENDKKIPFYVSDYAVYEDKFVIAITIPTNDALYVGFSNSKNEQVYGYDLLETFEDDAITKKKYLYQVDIGKDTVEDIVFFSRIVPKGEDKAKVESFTLPLAEITVTDKNEESQNITDNNNFQVIG